MEKGNCKFLVYFYLFLFISICPNILLIHAAEPVQAATILRQVFETNKKIKTLSYTVLMKERIGNDNIQKKTDFKIIFEPYQIYLKQYYPNKGLEILYNRKVTGDKALLNRNSIAFSLLRLDPTGNMMRKESHHSIFKAGFTYLLEVVEYLYRKYPEENTSVWHNEGLVKYFDITCYKIVFENPCFGFADYIIKEGENLEILSRKIKVCDYMIFENNPHLHSFDDFRAGMKIKVPTDYARQIIIYVDKEKLLPVGVKVYDDKGSFEEYMYTNIRINPVFSAGEFEINNPVYGFR